MARFWPFDSLARTAVAVLSGIAVGLIYRTFDPAHTSWMLRCPLQRFAGLSCPLCGMQRALHAVMHGAWSAAWSFNYALPFFVVWAAVLWSTKHFRRTRRWHERLDSGRAWIGYVAAFLLWGVLRNALGV